MVIRNWEGWRTWIFPESLRSQIFRRCDPGLLCLSQNAKVKGDFASVTTYCEHCAQIERGTLSAPLLAYSLQLGILKVSKVFCVGQSNMHEIVPPAGTSGER